MKKLEIYLSSSVELSNGMIAYWGWRFFCSLIVVLQAAAAMCVGMGSFADPYEAQGLAHFLGFQVYFELQQFRTIE